MSYYTTLPVARLLELHGYALVQEANAEYADAPGMRDREIHEARQKKAEILQEIERRTRAARCAQAWLEETRAAFARRDSDVPSAVAALTAIVEGRMPKQEGA